MSVCYSIRAQLNLQFTKTNVHFIVQKAFDVGFIYMVMEDFGITSRRLNVDEATAELLTITEDILDDGGPFLYGKFHDTGILIKIYEVDNNQLGFSFGSFCYQWDKDFSNGFRKYTIDFARYIRLMLQTCEDITLLGLVTFTDELDDIVYDNKNCVTVVLDMGDFGRPNVAGFDDGKLSVKYVLCNAVQNGITFFDKQLESLVEPSAQQYYEILKAGFPAYLYAKKDGALFKVEIKRMGHGCEFVSVYPLEPYRMKKGYGSEEEKIDMAFYVQRLLELCENFAIYELKTFW